MEAPDTVFVVFIEADYGTITHGAYIDEANACEEVERLENHSNYGRDGCPIRYESIPVKDYKEV